MRFATRFTITGQQLRLSDRASHAFAMTIHELATNAAKYGALSNHTAKGRVGIEASAYSKSGQILLSLQLERARASRSAVEHRTWLWRPNHRE